MRGFILAVVVLLFVSVVVGCGGGGGGTSMATSGSSYTLELYQAAAGQEGPMSPLEVTSSVIAGKNFSVQVDPIKKDLPVISNLTLTWFKWSGNEENKIVPQVIHTDKEDYYVLEAGKYTIVTDFKAGGTETSLSRTFQVKPVAVPLSLGTFGHNEDDGIKGTTISVTNTSDTALEVKIKIQVSGKDLALVVTDTANSREYHAALTAESELPPYDSCLTSANGSNWLAQSTNPSTHGVYLLIAAKSTANLKFALGRG